MEVPEPWGPRLTGHENRSLTLLSLGFSGQPPRFAPAGSEGLGVSPARVEKKNTYRCLGQIWDSLPKNLGGGLIFSLGNNFSIKWSSMC